MASGVSRWPIALVILVMSAYVTVVFRNLNESERRSLALTQSRVDADNVGISLRVVSVNPGSSELTARISFRLGDKLAQDRVTPTTDLKFFVNYIRGHQEIDFPRGQRMDPIEEVFSLDGNVNQ